MRRSLPALVASTLLLAACSGSGSSSDAAPGSGSGADDDGAGVTRPDSSAAFGWTTFGDDDSGVEIGSFEVPIDHDDPAAGTFDLYVARHLATDPDARIGSLFVNPGGPGLGASDFAIYADQVYSDDLLAHFDIVGFDPRGTGLSTPTIDCIDDYDRFYAEADVTPDDDAERQLLVDQAMDFQSSCIDRSGDIVQHIGTNDVASDMDSIRAALGEATTSYFGFSYGSELGATWATLFPDTVRAMVLDGAIDPNADFEQTVIDQAAGFEQTLATFLARCSSDDECAFHHDGDAEGAFDALMARLDEDPIPTTEGRPPANRQVAVNAVVHAMYLEALWPELEQALADAEQGDGSGLLALHDAYFDRRDDGSYPNYLEAFQTISCMDRAERPTVAEDDAAAAAVHAAAPRISPGDTGSYQCSFFPAAEQPRIAVTAAGVAGPILVVGTTGDPATPLASTQAMAEALDGGVLLTVEADQHTGYGVNDCSIEVVDRVLVERELPAAGTRCT